MATIGSLNVNLGMSTAAFTAGAKKARETVSGLASGISSATSVVPGLGAALAGIGAALSAGAIAAGFQSIVSGAMDTIDAAGDLAARVGTSTEALTRLQYATQLTGSEAESLTPALEKLNVNLGKAKAGDEMSKSLEKIGLNAESLKQLDPAEAFLQIADGIKGLPGPADKAAAAMAVFGKQGTSLVNTLNVGSDELRALMEESDRLGNTITDVDAAKIGAANDALDKMWKVLGGIGNDIAVELAPFIEVAATKLVEFGTEGNRVGKIASAGFELVAKSIAIAADVFDLLVLGFKGAQYLITKGLALQSELWVGIAKGVAFLAEKLGKKVDISFITGLNEELHRTADSIGQDFMDTLTGPSSGEKVKQFFDEIKSGAQAAAEASAKTAKSTLNVGEASEQAADGVQKLIEKYEQQVKLFGKEGRDLEIAQSGAQGEQLQKLQALSAQLKGKEEDKKRLEDAKQLREGLQTPLQKFHGELAKINKLTARTPADLAKGMLSGDEANLAKLQAQKEFAEATKKEAVDPGLQRPAALERGTAAAFSASFGPVAKPIDKVAKLNEQILAVQRRIEQKLGGTPFAIGA